MCYLSIICVGSNESYGGNFLERMQNCVNSIFDGAAKHNLNAEFILVEWGNPANRKPMREAIDWSHATIPVRIIHVPRSLVDTLENPQKIFLEPWAKSVGIRRACGKFVLTINADSIHSDELMEFLSKEELDPACFYRVNRYDTRCDGGTTRVFQVMRANGTFRPDEEYIGVTKSGVPYSEDMLHFNASGEYILMTKEKYHEIHGWPELTFWGSVDGMVVHLATTVGLKQVVLPYKIFHADHGRKPHWQPDWHDGKPYAIKNGDSWGFRDVEFPETRLGRIDET